MIDVVIRKAQMIGAADGHRTYEVLDRGSHVAFRCVCGFCTDERSELVAHSNLSRLGVR